MNEPTDAADPSGTPAPEAAAPARRRRSAAAAKAAAEPGAVPASPAAEGEAPAAAPRRRRSPAKAAPLAGEDAAPAAAEAAAPAETAAPAAAPADEAPAPPRRRAPRKSAAAAAEAAGTEPSPAAAAEAAPAELPAAPVAAPQAAASAPSRGEPPALPSRAAASPADEAEDGAAPALAARPGRPVQVPPPVESLVESAALFSDLIAGAYDPEAASGAAAGEIEGLDEDDGGAAEPGKRVLEADADAPKLHKVLAQSGVGSRRDMEQLIADGQVTVNGEVAHLGMRVVVGDRVEVKGKPVRLRIHPPTARVLAYHKPVGEVVTHSDPEGRPTVFRHLPRLPQGKWLSVGRLDINTEGLLLFSNSGDLANRLMHPRFGVEREYAVRVLGQLDELKRAQLLAGVAIDGQLAAFRSIDNGGGEGVNHWYRVVIAEGRNREVRKLFESVGLTVSRLIRIRYGSVVLPRGLKRGVWVELEEPDLKVIRQLAGLNDGPRPAPAAKTGKAARGPKPMQNGPRPQPADGPARGPASAGGGKSGKAGGAGGKFGPGGKGPRPAGGPSQGGKPPRAERPPREVLRDADGEVLIDDIGRIPNPLEQTFDRRFAKGGPRRPAQGFGGAQRVDDDYIPGGAIPNPLEQTFDRRFVKGSQRIVAGFGRPDSGEQGGPAGGPKGPKGGPKQPDPMQTSVGYIGADAYFNKGGKKGGGGGGGGNWGGKRRGR